MSLAPQNLYCGTATASSTAAQLTTSPSSCASIIVQADVDNTVDLYIGNATTQALRLLAGQVMTLGINNPAAVYISTLSSTAKARWLAQGF